MRRRWGKGTTCINSSTQRPSAVAAAALPALQMKKPRHREFANSPTLTRLVSDRQDLNPGRPESESRAYLLRCTVPSGWDEHVWGWGKGIKRSRHVPAHTRTPRARFLGTPSPPRGQARFASVLRTLHLHPQWTVDQPLTQREVTWAGAWAQRQPARAGTQIGPLPTLG